MKKLIFITAIMCLWALVSMAQMTTNKVVRTIMITSSNSPIEIGYYLTAGVAMANATVPQPFTHSLVNFNPGNVVCVIQNTSPIGHSAFHFKNSSGVDCAYVGFDNSTSNVLLRSFMGDDRRIQLDVISGGQANALYIQRLVTTNNGPFVANSISSTNYMVNGVRGLTLSVTNVGIGETNISVYAQGLLTNKFTIP